MMINSISKNSEYQHYDIPLLYHEILSDGLKSGFQNKDNLDYMHHEVDFKRHVELTTQKLSELAVKNRVPTLLFTFDDGGLSGVHTAEILKENGIKAYFFITTSKINQEFFVTKEDIKTIRNMGHIIGSHSHTHPMIFRQLRYEQMLSEWRYSKAILEDILQENILSCSIPGGDADRKTYESAWQAGFKQIFDSEPIIGKRNCNDAEIVGRFSIKKQTSDKRLLEIVEMKGIARLQAERKIKSFIKRLIFPIHSYNQNKKNGK